MYNVTGRITLANGEPVSGVTVRAYDRDLRSQQLLGEATTDEDGHYEIIYTSDQFTDDERESADLVIRAFNESGTELNADSDRTDTIFNAERKEVVDLKIVSDELVRPSEYTRLVAAITSVMGDAALADLTEDDIRFLANDTGQKEDSIRFLSQAAQLQEEYNIPEAVFYGLARQNMGLVDGETGPRIELPRLLEEEERSLRRNLKTGVSTGIIPTEYEDAIHDIVAQLKALPTEQQR